MVIPRPTAEVFADYVKRRRPDVAARWDAGKLWAYQAPFLEQRAIQRGYAKDRERFAALFLAFRRYAGLASVSEKPVPMISKSVDELWHQFILFTKEYQEFCAGCLPRFLHHAPTTDGNPAKTREFLSAYSEAFGVVDEVWKENLPPANEDDDYADCDDGPRGGSSDDEVVSCVSDYVEMD